MHGLRIKTPEDIQKLAGYISKVDPGRNPISHIITSYYIRPFEIPCGLCGQPHMEGKIVAVVGESGTSKPITNIGHICGKNRFGDSYLDANRRHIETTEKPLLIQRVSEGLSKVQSLEFPMHTLRLRAEDLKRRENRFSELFPDTYRELRRRAFNSRADIYESVERTAEEVADLMAANRFQNRDSLRVKEEYRGTVSGHRLPGTDWSLDRGALRIFVEANKFVERVPRSMSMQELWKWANWLEDLDESLEAAKSTVAEGERFFTPENFYLFSFLPGPHGVRNQLKELTVATLDARPRMPTVAPAATPRLGRIRAQAASMVTSKERRRLLGNKRAR